MKQRLRVAIAGAGWVTQHHLPAWTAQSHRVEVVAICDPDRARAVARAVEFGIGCVYTDRDRMLDEVAPDILDVATPRESHAEWVLAAAERGIAVLCQKPLAPTHEEARALAEAVAGKARLMVHENWRHRPYYRDAGRWLGEQRIGRVVQAHMNLLSSGLVADAGGAYPALVRQPFLKTLGRALVMEILIHHIDTLRFLLGELRLVHSEIGRACQEMRGEDRATLLFETEEGAPVTVVANLAAHGEPAALEDHLVLIGERGTIRLAGDTLSCHGEDVEVRRYDGAESYGASYAATIAHFVDALVAGAPFETGPSDNLRTLALVEAVYAGARSEAQCAV